MRSLEGDVARLRTQAYATEAARGPLTEQLAFAMARSDALEVRLQECYRRVVYKEVEQLTRRKARPECPCQRCGCRRRVEDALTGACSGRQPPEFEDEAADANQCLHRLERLESFEVPTLRMEGDDESLARLTRALQQPESWQQTSLLRDGTYVAPVQRAARKVNDTLPGMPRHPPGLPSPPRTGADANRAHSSRGNN